MATTPTPDVVALVRRLYQDGVPVKDIGARTGLTLGAMYRCIDGKFDDGSGVPPAPIPRRRADTRTAERIGSRGALIARMWRTAERQVGEIEDRLKAAGLELAERESNTRMLAIVARTLRELSAVDEAEKARGKEASKDNNDDAPPRNIDELRRALADKLEAFVARTGDAVPDRTRMRSSLRYSMASGTSFGHGHQRPPPDDWTTWLLLGGRGAGKTRAGAEWVRHLALTEPKQSPIALIGETEHDAREVMVEGVSGLLSVHESFNRPTWIPSRRRIEWNNGAVAQVFSAEDPESLRGPQFAAAWCDELAKWRHAEAGYGNHPSDPGGPTNFGITIADYRRYVKPGATAADVRAMRSTTPRRSIAHAIGTRCAATSCRPGSTMRFSTSG